MNPLLTELYQNLPLVLSDTQDLKGISLIRIMAVIAFLVIIVSPLLAYVIIGDKGLTVFYPYWEKFLLFLGTSVVANVVKKFT